MSNIKKNFMKKKICRKFCSFFTVFTCYKNKNTRMSLQNILVIRSVLQFFFSPGNNVHPHQWSVAYRGFFMGGGGYVWLKLPAENNFCDQFVFDFWFLLIQQLLTIVHICRPRQFDGLNGQLRNRLGGYYVTILPSHWVRPYQW